MLCGDSVEFEILNELVEESDDLPVLGVLSCFMWRNLNRMPSYFEGIIPFYNLRKFQSHLTLTWAAF